MDEFIDKVLVNQHCCCGLALDRQCVIGVGIPCNEAPQPLRGQAATAVVMVRCPECGEFHQYMMTVPGEILHAYLSSQARRPGFPKKDKSNGSLPDWLQHILGQLMCPKCSGRTGEEGLAGVAYAASDDPLPAGRIAATYLLMQCIHCSYRFMAGTPAGLTEFREAADAIQHHLFRQATRELTGCQGEGNVATEQSSDASAPGKRAAVRPSIRRNQPKTPITDKEVRAFLNNLRRTSFRRSSKSFRRWQARMGIDGW